MPLRIGVIATHDTQLLSAVIRVAQQASDVEVALVAGGVSSARALSEVDLAGVQTLSFADEVHESPLMADEIIAVEMHRREVDYLVVADLEHVVHAPILSVFKNRVLHIHASLLPSFDGDNPVEQALYRGVKVTGVTACFATPDYMDEPIVAQRAVEVAEGATVESLTEELHAAARELLSASIECLAAHAVEVDADGRVAFIAK